MNTPHDPFETTSVLVVGGSLVGLSAALCLAHHGVPTIVLERHASSSCHPRALGVTPRSMEIYRSMGLDSKIPQVPPNFQIRRARVESLAGEWFNELPWTDSEEPPPSPTDFSPCAGAAIPQDRIEPILRDRAIELGADVRLQSRLVNFQQDADGVRALVQDGSGFEYQIRASYMIAADGCRSFIRDRLAIPRSGRGVMQTVRSVVFRAPLERYLKEGITQFMVEQSDLKCFMTAYRDGRYMIVAFDDLERNKDEMREMIARVIGRDNVPIEIVTAGRWELSALIAESFSSGRIFLVGDSAHTLPPNRGGYGANTGIDDAHNLAWKMAQVLSGAASPRLLDTYDTERQPIARLRHQQIFVRSDFESHRKREPGKENPDPVFDDIAMEFGQRYSHGAVISHCERTGEKDLPPAMRPEQWAGLPGTRAPHLWGKRHGETISTLDLFGREWVLVSESADWDQALACVLDKSVRPLPARSVQVGVDVMFDDQAKFGAAFGLSSTGASLVRPDGYVAWRSRDAVADPEHVLGMVFQQVMGFSDRQRHDSGIELEDLRPLRAEL